MGRRAVTLVWLVSALLMLAPQALAEPCIRPFWCL